MKTKAIHTPEGVRDYLAGECAGKDCVAAAFSDIFKSYGYQKVQSPSFEFLEVFNEALTDKSQSRLYKFTDDMGALLALRPDMTPGIVRLAATAFKHEQGALRFSYCGSTYTNHELGQGKRGETTQAGIELMGDDSPLSDAEIIEITVRGVMEAGIERFKVNVGHTGFINGVIGECGFGDEVNSEIYDALNNMDYAGVTRIVKGLSAPDFARDILCNIPFLIGGKDILYKYKQIARNEVSQKAVIRLMEICDVLDELGLLEHIMFDLGIINHIDYYTGLLFRVYAEGAAFPVASGGRYDNLMAKFGKDVPAVGVSVKIDTIAEAARKDKKAEQAIRVFLAYDSGFRKQAHEHAKHLREQGLCVTNDLSFRDRQSAIDYTKQRGFDRLYYVNCGVSEIDLWNI